jgi:hypothetical protein
MLAAGWEERELEDGSVCYVELRTSTISAAHPMVAPRPKAAPPPLFGQDGTPTSKSLRKEGLGGPSLGLIFFY